MEFITAYLTTKVLAYTGASLVGLILAWILKKIPNEDISKKVEGFFHWLGKWVTLTASKKSKLWNKIVEPYVIDLIENVVLSALQGFIRGLRSDGDKTGDQE